MQVPVELFGIARARAGVAHTTAQGDCLGDVLAYKLLEIGADFQPSVSEVRCGRYETGSLRMCCESFTPFASCCWQRWWWFAWCQHTHTRVAAVLLRVAGLDAAAQAVTLEPYPDPQVHPLSFRRAQALARRREEAGWGEADEEEDEEDEDLDGESGLMPGVAVGAGLLASHWISGCI